MLAGISYSPDVVLYEESLDYKTITDSINHISKADTLIIGGTSLSTGLGIDGKD